ncbi:unnamed protein product [Tilletia controversa]|uniref:Uncharacterized protein n=2 Tax=Tilletia TaxID=13289 RepID=A0A177V8F1_9BASI|nr:hypothetical protein CF336_g4402 [Tilletia laevis]KAE8260994.1 hypothetical protein A4X03_0g3633 [Tilletia caries]CAD6927643.1 unnamed protein product [Tilletia controversa]KAE8202327.1 hypothetical protein CF335_g3464 [Tilletia laevis]CAD6888393.1 unnamed protein product [Tilletia caries]
MTTIEYNAPWQLYALAWSNVYHPFPAANSSTTATSSSQNNNNNNNSFNTSAYAPAPAPRQRDPCLTLDPTTSFPLGARIAIGSFQESFSNRIQLLQLAYAPSQSTTTNRPQPVLEPIADAPHPYPPTKILFQPSTLPVHNERELLATSADCLRVWECAPAGPADDLGYIGSQADGKRVRQLPVSLKEKSVLAHSKSASSAPAPLTSFSWNSPSPNLIVTSSIDTTCTIWDLPTRTALTQLIAHDREVYDVDWCPGSSDVFASVGADGSVRVFDLRSLEHSTIIYETGSTTAAPPSSAGGAHSRPGSSASRSAGGYNSGPLMPAAPLLRIAFNPWDANYLATFHLESDSVQILDVRAPGTPILELRGHSSPINAVAWGPPGNTSVSSSSFSAQPSGSSGLPGGGGGGGGSGAGGPGGLLGANSHFSGAYGGFNVNSSSGPLGSSGSKGMVSTVGDDAQCLVYDLASSTLRSASAQGRRSRNGHAGTPGAAGGAGAGGGASGASPAPSSVMSSSSNATTRVGMGPGPGGHGGGPGGSGGGGAGGGAGGPGGMGFMSNASSTTIGAASVAFGAETPVLAYTAEEMINNVSWLRAPLPGPSSPSSSSHSHGSQGGGGVVQEWDEYTAAVSAATGYGGAGGGHVPASLRPGVGGTAAGHAEWLALTSGRKLTALRV